MDEDSSANLGEHSSEMGGASGSSGMAHPENNTGLGVGARYSEQHNSGGERSSDRPSGGSRIHNSGSAHVQSVVSDEEVVDEEEEDAAAEDAMYSAVGDAKKSHHRTSARRNWRVAVTGAGASTGQQSEQSGAGVQLPSQQDLQSAVEQSAVEGRPGERTSKQMRALHSWLQLRAGVAASSTAAEEAVAPQEHADSKATPLTGINLLPGNNTQAKKASPGWSLLREKKRYVGVCGKSYIYECNDCRKPGLREDSKDHSLPKQTCRRRAQSGWLCMGSLDKT